jgi:hypothetical protein
MDTRSSTPPNSSAVDPGLHVISYAYPSSPLATALRCSRVGCFALQRAGSVDPHRTFSDALRAAAAGGTRAVVHRSPAECVVPLA